MNVVCEFDIIDKLLIKVGDFLLKDNQKIAIHNVFEKLIQTIANITVKTKYRNEKQRRTAQFVKLLNRTKWKVMNKTNVTEVYSHLLQAIVEIYVWLMDIKTPNKLI